MPNLFPCPNNQCSYQFDADMLPPAAMVTCPLCRTKFPYRARQMAPTGGGEPNGGDGGAPTGEGGGGYDSPRSAAPERSAGPRVVSLRSAPKQNTVMVTVLWVSGFTLVLIGLIVAYFIWNKKGQYAGTKEYYEERLNFRLSAFRDGWEEDGELRGPLGLNVNVFAKKRTGPDAWAALFAQDFKGTNARMGELRDILMERVMGTGAKNKLFTNVNKVEMENPTWHGQPCMGYQWDGDFNDVHIKGECYAMSVKGIAYAWWSWAPVSEWDRIKDELTDMREKQFKLGSNRDGWQEERANVVTHSVNGYQVQDRDGKWKRARQPAEGEDVRKSKDFFADPKELDPACTMAFSLEFRPKVVVNRGAASINVRALVVELDGTEPIDAAKKSITNQYRRRFFDEEYQVKLTQVNLPSGAKPAGEGLTLAKFIAEDPSSPKDKEVWIFSVRSIKGKLVAVICNVAELHAVHVEEWMINLASTLRESQ